VGSEGQAKRGPRERHDGFTAARKKAFLEALAAKGTIADACRIAGVSRRTFYYHRDRWPDFAAACEAALVRAAGAVETLAWERATIGADEVTIRDGAVVQIRRKPSDAILRLLLMASNPRKYGRMAAWRRKAIEKETRERLRAEIEAQVRGEWHRRHVASREEVEAELVERLDALARELRAGEEGPEEERWGDAAEG
jgi:hypothetical protein